MDYVKPVETLLPGVQGKVLGVLARSDAELSMRAVARLAGVSPQQSSVVLGHLVELGIVERRDVPPVALVRLSPDNLAAQTVATFANLRQTVLDRLTDLAASIRPAPASLIVFGSFARGHAGPASDLDVLAVRPAGVSGNDDGWTDSLGAWSDRARRTVGNPINLIEVSANELPELLGRPAPSLWSDIVTDGVLLRGAPINTVGVAA
ncbi:MAG: MarR family transcriptional regulator [Actinomycetota bacterium]|nr:MarR family transcriptional regulator [Actinomycetota bacterium]